MGREGQFRFSPEKRQVMNSALDILRSTLEGEQGVHDIKRLLDQLKTEVNQQHGKAVDAIQQKLDSLPHRLEPAPYAPSTAPDPVEPTSRQPESVEIEGTRKEVIHVGDMWTEVTVILNDEDEVLYVDGSVEILEDSAVYDTALALFSGQFIETRDGISVNADAMNQAIKEGYIEFREGEQPGVHYEIAEKRRRYETASFDMRNEVGRLRGRRVFIVEADFPEPDKRDRDAVTDVDQIIRDHNDADVYTRYYNDYSTLLLIQIEGVDGVLAATKYHPDDWRSHFGGWVQIKDLPLKPERRDFGTIMGSTAIDTVEGMGSNKGTTISTSTGTIQFGTSSYDEYYPNGYCTVSPRQ